MAQPQLLLMTRDDYHYLTHHISGRDLLST